MTIAFRRGNPHGNRLGDIFEKLFWYHIHNYIIIISFVDIILAGGEVSSWSITERNGSSGEPWRAAAEV